MSLKFILAFLANFINEFLVVFAAAFVYMVVRNFFKITVYEVIVRNFSRRFAYIKDIEWEELTTNHLEFLFVIITCSIFMKNLYVFNVLSNKMIADLFMRPESLAGFLIALNHDSFYIESPRTGIAKFKVFLTCLTAVIFDGLLAAFFVPVVAVGLIKLVKISCFFGGSAFGPVFLAGAKSVVAKIVQTGFLFSVRFYILAFSALLARLIPLPFSDGFFILYPFMSYRVVNFLTDLGFFGKFMVRFGFILFFSGILEHIICGPLNTQNPFIIYSFMANAF